MSRTSARSALLLALALPAPRLFAWGFNGHAFITENAVNHLPAPLRQFVEGESDVVRANASFEPPGDHFIDIDVYPEFVPGSHNFPRNLSVLTAKYGSTYVANQGQVPWLIAGYRAQLASQMKFAKTPDDWLAAAATAGALAHYVADVHQPLHVTANYNGQFTGNTGVHSRYETTMVSRHLDDGGLAVAPAPQNCVYLPDAVDAVLSRIESTTYSYVNPVLLADTHARQAAGGSISSQTYYNTLWADTGAFTRQQFQLASEMVASMWYSAWVDAGSPTPIPEPAGAACAVVAPLLLARHTRKTTPPASRANCDGRADMRGTT